MTSKIPPILFLIFNRPDTTKVTFELLRSVKPKYLYIAADGPRANKDGEIELCELTRKLVLDNIDWDCEVKTLLRTENLGCGVAVYKAITWFFENVESGIILEDDCLPDNSFFPFCAELLERYKDNQRVMHISGNNFQFGKKYGDESYYFSKYSHNWGWATWKRAWEKYQFQVTDFDKLFEKKYFHDLNMTEVERDFWFKTFEELKSGKTDVWDGQWLFAIFKNNGVSILPNVNLVKNIGFDSNATHTTYKYSIVSNLKTKPLKTLIHPDKIEINEKADARSFNLIFMNNLTFLMKTKFKLLHKLDLIWKRKNI